jgi:thiamine biosynthesis lipoprotein
MLTPNRSTVCLTVACCLGAPDPAAGQVWIERELVVMGTRLTMHLAAPTRESALAASNAAFAAIQSVDELLSTWRAETELGRVNRAPVGQAAPLSPRLTGVLAEVLRWWTDTRGAFDPAVGSLVEVWDLRGAGRRPSDGELARARAAAGLHRYAFDSASGTLIRPDTAAWLDSGGFGKGLALREARAALRARGVTNALLNFGGQLLALGAGSGSSPWIATVAHPAGRDVAVMRLALRDASLATTSQSERYVTVRGERYGHVLDPRSGQPVPPWGSTTVLATDPLAADALSTALFVLGPAEARSWAEGHDDVGVLLLVATDSTITPFWNAALAPFLHYPAPGAPASAKEIVP